MTPPAQAQDATAQDAQRDFAAAVVDAARPVPAGLRTHNGSDPLVRFGVYRNNVLCSLVAALADTFPVVRELVGADFFDAMARQYLAAQPPRSPVLAHYGDGFADWLQAFAPAAGVPCLADMARLERARVRAFHAADAPSLSAADIAPRLADPQRLPGARLHLHPSVSVITSEHAIVSLWAAHQGHGDLAQVDPALPEAALVLRANDDAVVLGQPLPAAAFCARLQQGIALGDAAAAAGDGFDLGASLALLIRHGALVDWLDPGDTP